MKYYKRLEKVLEKNKNEEIKTLDLHKYLLCKGDVISEGRNFLYINEKFISLERKILEIKSYIKFNIIDEQDKKISYLQIKEIFYFWYLFNYFNERSDNDLLNIITKVYVLHIMECLQYNNRYSHSINASALYTRKAIEKFIVLYYVVDNVEYCNILNVLDIIFWNEKLIELCSHKKFCKQNNTEFPIDHECLIESFHNDIKINLKKCNIEYDKEDYGNYKKKYIVLQKLINLDGKINTRNKLINSFLEQYYDDKERISYLRSYIYQLDSLAHILNSEIQTDLIFIKFSNLEVIKICIDILNFVNDKLDIEEMINTS